MLVTIARPAGTIAGLKTSIADRISGIAESTGSID